MTITSESLADFGVRNITAYATEVNLDRAVPELYDGLKPVFRRVAWSAHAFNPKETVKSAKIVGHCFAAGTKVLKREGQTTVETPIEAIKVGHAVLTDAPCRFANDTPFRLVTKTFVIPQQKLLRVTTTTSTVDCTTDQVFYGADDREIQASKLLVGDKLKTVYCGELTLATVLSVDALTGLHDVYDIEVEQRHRFYANGLLSHNCIGSYHPHGDCLDGDTEFYCLDGKVRTIRDIYESGVDSIDVLSYDSKTGTLVPAVAHSFRIGQRTKKTYQITFSNGTTIEATANHPFFVRGEGWVKAEDLEVGMPMASGGIIMDADYRSICFSNASYRPIYSLVVPDKKLSANQIRHHINHNRHDDRPSNLAILSRAEHAKHHKESYLKGLQLGRDSLFGSPRSKMRQAVKRKNSALMTAYNKALPLIKAVKVVTYLLERNIPVTPENYEAYRAQVMYGATRLGSLQKYGHDLDSVKKIALNGGYKLDTSAAVGFTKGLSKKRHRVPRSLGVKNRSSLLINCSRVITRMYADNAPITWESYEEYRSYYTHEIGGGYGAINGRSVPTRQTLCRHFQTDSFATIARKIAYLGYGVSIKKIAVITYGRAKPMYDFTVDGLQNAIVLLPRKHDGRRVFIVAHNSAAYGAMQTMVNSNVPLLDGIGNWGSLLDPPAAMRYTVCRLSKVGLSVMDSDYLAVTSMVPNYDDTTTEPVVLPAKLPFLILNGAEGIGVGITCSIPTFTVESVVDVLTRLLSGEKLKVTDLARLLKPKQYYGGRLVNSESNKAQWLQLMKTGQASVEFEAPLEVDEAKKQITVGEWPNGLNPEKFVQKVRAMPETQRCYNSKGSTTFVIECKKAYNMVQFHDFVEKVRKLARAKSNYKFNCTHRVAKTEDGITTYQTQFLKLSVGQFIVQWLKLRIELEKRVINYRIAREQKAIDYSNLLLYASTKLDVIFKALRSSDAVAYMVRNMDVDETQAKAILELKVRQLSKLDQAEIKQKLAAQKKRMTELQANLKRPKNSVKKEMQSLLTLVKEDAILRDKKDNQKLIVK